MKIFDDLNVDDLQKQLEDVLGNINRFFSDKPDSETLQTKSTGDEKTFKAKKCRI